MLSRQNSKMFENIYFKMQLFLPNNERITHSYECANETFKSNINKKIKLGGYEIQECSPALCSAPSDYVIQFNRNFASGK